MSNISLIRKNGSDLIVEVTALDNSNDGTDLTGNPPNLKISIEKRTGVNLYWDESAPDDFTSAVEILYDMVYVRDGLHEYVLPGAAESVDRSYRIRVQVTGAGNLNTDAVYSQFIPAASSSDATLANQNTILSRMGVPSDLGSGADISNNAVDIDAKTQNLPVDPASETNVDANEAKLDTIDTVVDAIKNKTDNLPADPASETNVDANETKIDTIISTGGSGPWTSGAVGSVTLEDNAANRAVLDKMWDALRSAHTVSGSFGEYVLSNVIRWNGSSTIDGKSLTLWGEIMLAYTTGRFKVNFPNNGQITFYRQDNLTPLFVLGVTTAERTRI